jgi:uncharacterized protein
MAVQVVNNSDQHRYEIRVDGTPVGFAAYEERPGVLTFTHTEIDSAYEGKGLGSVLARSALEGTRTNGQQVVPLCPFITDYIRRHPKYLDIVVPERRAALEETID